MENIICSVQGENIHGGIKDKQSDDSYDQVYSTNGGICRFGMPYRFQTGGKQDCSDDNVNDVVKWVDHEESQEMFTLRSGKTYIGGDEKSG